MNIDIHAHFVPRSCFDVADGSGNYYGFRMKTNSRGEEEAFFGEQSYGATTRQVYDPEVRIKDMDKSGVDMQVLSPMPPLFYYNLEPEKCLWFCQKVNDGIAEVVRQYPKRFRGMAMVPLQAPEKAASELERAVKKLGLLGVEIGSNIGGKNLDEPEFTHFFQKVESLDVPIFIHPRNVAGAERLKKYHLANLIGNPLDTTIAAASLIFGGVFERFPRLKVVLSHGGGYVPYQRGRWDHGYSVRAEGKVVIKRPPSHYIPLLYFDTITHFTPALEYLVATAGADKVVMGTDYPADMGDTTPVSTVYSLKTVPQGDKEKISGQNAARIFKL